ncbi:uncharacterized protein EDB91DRAFT_1087649 [Suillus paluster]|uniref:uncharacterized protein n=1 Tax=Suillus paluster TaxID=48578 RepID=UPI001B86DCDF|nr:uncharacterized protein EDB91DRAFT_1087649 [Suillus paluster]KAG1723996.1 hypothetical protein EDB91DRAFT_1087649 [Suillus paluster]
MTKRFMVIFGWRLGWYEKKNKMLLELEQLVNDGKCKDCGEGEGLKGIQCILAMGGEPCPNISHQPDPSPWEDLGAMKDVFAQEEGDTINDMQLGVSNLVIVHSTGVYSHSVSWCQCSGAEKAQHLHLMKARLFPASITRPQSAFTFDVLDNFLIDTLECKTSAMSFYQKLHQFTNNAFPDKILDKKDCYCELMQVSHIWRDLVNKKRFGFGHDIKRSPGPRDLALYCPACPQPGINLPMSWRYDYEEWLVMQRYVVDGNFTAQHMKMKIPEDDVSLADGKGYMKSTCNNHQAVNEANIQRSNLRATGVGAPACARHGCFVPHAVVDFQKGEWHMNMDYSICNTVKYMPEHIGSVLIIYDVAFKSLLKKYCQALQGVSDTQGPYEELTRSLDLDDVQEWKKAVEKAAQDRGELLDIYQPKMDRLTENELSANGRTGSVAWLIEGINIENAQQKLMAWIIKFYEAAEVMTNDMELKGGEGAPLDNPELCLEEADISSMEDPEEEDFFNFEGNIDSPAEVTEIWMPSWAASGHIMNDKNSSFERVKQTTAWKSFVKPWVIDQSCFGRKYTSTNQSITKGTRSKKELQKITLSINRQARVYSRARAAMLHLGADSDTVAVYQPLKPQDLVDNNAEDSQKNIWMNEFYHVNWLKVKARYDHWSEELKLVQHEMFWTISWFWTQEERWRVQADESIKNGNRAYAERRASMWAEFSAQGLKNFEGKLHITKCKHGVKGLADMLWASGLVGLPTSAVQPPSAICMSGPANILWASGPVGLPTPAYPGWGYSMCDDKGYSINVL